MSAIPSNFKDIFISSPDSLQQEIVSSLLSLSLSSKEMNEVQADNCPHCKDKRIRANGKLKGVQRYVCNSRHKNFSETRGKFWYCIKEKLNRYLYCLLSGYSIQTSFDWRHKLLTSFSDVSVSTFQGILERDDLFFDYSDKGSRDLERKGKKRVGKASKS